MLIEEFIEKFNHTFDTLKKMKNIGIWGIGRHTELLFQHTILPQLSITHIIDKNNFGSKFMNFTVENPLEINWTTTNIEAVIVVSLKYQNEICEMLKNTFNYSGKIITLYEKEDTDIFYLAQSKYMPISSKLELNCSKLKDILSRLRYDIQYSQMDSFEIRFQKNYRHYQKIKLYRLLTERIGEVICRFLNILDDLSIEPNTFHLFLPDNNHFDFCNSNLLEIMSRNIEIVNQDNLLFWNYVFDTHADVIDTSTLDLYEARKFITYHNQKNHSFIQFSIEEKNIAEQKLKEIGIPKNYVCIHTRDAEYLDNLSKKIAKNSDWHYHDYRDINIHNYEEAISYLEKNEIMSVRMGKFTTKPFTYPGCIDYAFLYQDDLLDIYLPSKCKFFVGNPSGLILLPQLFGTPCAIANVTPIIIGEESTSYIDEDIMIPKKMWHIKEKRFLNLKEMFDMDLNCCYRTENYLNHNIKLIENTSEEILDLTIEMNQKLDNTWKETEEMIVLQKKYTSIRDTWLKENNMPTAGAFQCQIGSNFLLKNKFLLDI